MPAKSAASYGTSVVLVSLALCLAAPAQNPWGVPFFVQNDADVTRTNEPVATGFPLPVSGNVLLPDVDLELVDDTNTAVPVQFKTLARWYGPRNDTTKPAKWVLATFNATVPANSVRAYFLRLGTHAVGQIATQDLAGEVRVTTGPAEFVVDKNAFSVFKQVSVGGSVVTGGAGSLDLRDVAGALVAAVVTETLIEEPGTVRCVVRQKGELPALGLAFTARYYFWTGRTDVRVDFRLENPGGYGELPYTGQLVEHAWFEDLSLTLRVPQTADVATSSGAQASNGASYRLEQGFGTPSTPTQMLTGFEYTATLGGATVETGNRHAGAIAINSPSGAIAACVDRFWQNFPKSLAATGNALSVGLWPAFGNGPEYSGVYGLPTAPATDPLSTSFYRFEGGRWKTYTVHFDFSPDGTFSPTDLDAMAKRVNKPLMALLQPRLAMLTLSFGTAVVERRNWTRASNQRYERLLDVLVRNDAADFQPTLGKIGFPAFRDRGGTYGGHQMYGWVNFGDVGWGDGYCSLHYDLPWGVLINYYRTGDYAFFDVGRDLAVHRRDYDQLHTTDPSAANRGGQSYEKGWFHGNYNQPEASHTWVNGLLVHYVMTGDEGSFEAALEVGEFIKRRHPETWDGWWGSRILGWQVEALLNLYSYVGDPSYLQIAQQALGNFEGHELADGGAGYHLNPGWTSNPHAQTWMHAIVLNALGKYYFVSGFDPAALPLMSRMADWMALEVVKELPTGPTPSRTKGKVWGRFAPGWHADPSTHHQWVVLESLTWAAVSLHRTDLIHQARLFWESATRYHQAGGGDEGIEDYNDPSSWSPIAFRMLQYPNSESKIMSNIALWGQTFMAFDLFWDNAF